MSGVREMTERIAAEHGIDDLDAWLLDRRADGLSYEAIARALDHATNATASPSMVTVRAWCLAAEARRRRG